jgi:hypothetical protein
MTQSSGSQQSSSSVTIGGGVGAGFGLTAVVVAAMREDWARVLPIGRRTRASSSKNESLGLAVLNTREVSFERVVRWQETRDPSMLFLFIFLNFAYPKDPRNKVVLLRKKGLVSTGSNPERQSLICE